jgi:hypothetical protein
MNEERQDGGAQADPEQRAFGGGADMPPREPDQPQDGNEELARDGGQGEGSEPTPKPDEQSNPHGDYGSLPGYGG